MNLTDLKALCGKATKTKWKVRRNQSTNKPACQVTNENKEVICSMAKGDFGLDDAQLIAVSRTALPNALALIDEMKAALTHAQAHNLLPKNTDSMVEQALAKCREFEKDVTK